MGPLGSEGDRLVLSPYTYITIVLEILGNVEGRGNRDSLIKMDKSSSMVYARKFGLKIGIFVQIAGIFVRIAPHHCAKYLKSAPFCLGLLNCFRQENYKAKRKTKEGKKKKKKVYIRGHVASKSVQTMDPVPSKSHARQNPLIFLRNGVIKMSNHYSSNRTNPMEYTWATGLDSGACSGQ